VTMPREAAYAMEIESICQRYHCTPGQARREPVSTRRHMQIIAALDEAPR